MDLIERASAWTKWPLDDGRHRQLLRYGEWLVEEAIPGGGLGPNEKLRVDTRHLADSIVFAGAWDRQQPPRTVLDLGSGVGLPGIPLAVLWPQTTVTLLDRSAKRVQMARRAGRVLNLDNVMAFEKDISAAGDTADMVVARAAGPIADVLNWATKATEPGGLAVIGGSWVEPPTPVASERILQVPAEVLDRPVWLRIMAAS